ncbi:MAG: purine-nucleoside phosphorylase [Myxococcales bacterium]|nr:purine-nucleoside phosphorylase [Myxococcales bacterium]
MSSYLSKLDETVAHLRQHAGQAPHLALVLGSGLGAFADELTEAKRLHYSQVPHFPTSKVSGHAGELVIGNCGELRVVVMSGRVHYYEGHPMSTCVFAVRALARWGVEQFCITNSAGGVDTSFHPGDLMVITDHLNLMGSHPLLGGNIDELGVRFPDMSHAYNPQLRALLCSAAIAASLSVRQGVYAGLSGPSYETPAEIRMLRAIGANAVGMSTVPEVIALNHMKRKVCGVSCITNMAAGILEQPLDHSEVKETAERVKDDFISLLRHFVALVAKQGSRA